jgi:hypothetical protein
MSQTKVVNLQDFAKELGVYSQAHLAQLKAATLDGIAKSVPTVVERSPVDTGLYAQSWGFTPTEFGAVLGNTAPHSTVIEFGARPFTPPIRPLLAWAKRVLQDPSQPPDYSSRVWGLAKYTQKKISEEGMQPRQIMQNSIPDILENIKQEFQKLG